MAFGIENMGTYDILAPTTRTRALLDDHREAMQTFRMSRDLVSFLKGEASARGSDLTAYVTRVLEGLRNPYGLPLPAAQVLEEDRKASASIARTTSTICSMSAARRAGEGSGLRLPTEAEVTRDRSRTGRIRDAVERPGRGSLPEGEPLLGRPEGRVGAAVRRSAGSSGCAGAHPRDRDGLARNTGPGATRVGEGARRGLAIPQGREVVPALEATPYWRGMVSTARTKASCRASSSGRPERVGSASRPRFPRTVAARSPTS